MDLRRIQETLQRAGVVFERGLDDGELRAIEAKYGFAFPPDLAAFLAYALPVGKSWVNWRSADERTIVARLDWPYDGICFDVEQSGFWLEAWGERPPDLRDAFAIVKRAVERAPKLIPICGHRYLPDRPRDAGNPVFSVYQTDIIHYGADLEDYLENEFKYYFGRGDYRIREPVRRIEFWSELVD